MRLIILIILLGLTCCGKTSPPNQQIVNSPDPSFNKQPLTKQAKTNFAIKPKKNVEKQSWPKLPNLDIINQAVLIAGDRIRIELAGEDKLSREFTIPGNGVIYYPYVKKVEAKGKTIEELNEILATKLDEYFVDPIINVTVVEWVERKVYVYGTKDGANSFSFSPTEGLTASRLLISAGVSRKEADLSRIFLVRQDDGKRYVARIPLQEIIESYDLEKDIVLQSNDMIIIKEATKVHVQGNVKEPGSFPIQKGDKITLWEVLSLANGPTEEADLHHIKILRQTTDQQYQLEVVSATNTQQGQMIFLNAEDIVVVPSESDNFVTVYGQVKKPGTVQLVGDSTRLSTVIALAGGMTQYASNSIRIFRYLASGDTRKFTIDFAAITSGDGEQDMTMQPGDVVYCDYGLW